jgi:DNA-nicking Smr family endonuclease
MLGRIWQWWRTRGQSSETRRDERELSEPPPLQVALDGVLDLHTFHPRDIDDVVREYVRACQAEGVFALRLIHGKGKGVQRRRVLAVLDSMPEIVAGHRVAEPHRGGWGATLVDLHPIRRS